MEVGKPGRAVIALVGLLALSACSRREAQLTPQKPAEVIVSPAVVREVTDYEEFTGRLKAFKEVQVRAHVTGYLDRVFFKDGDEVKEGDVLFEIDPRTYKAELDRAEASVNQALAHHKRLAGDHDRAQDLRRRSAVSAEEYAKIEGDRAEAAAAVKSADASRNLAHQNLDYTKVYARYSGHISDRRADPGNLIKADDTILTEIVVPNPIYASFDIDERTLLRIRRLLTVKSSSQEKILVQMALADEDDFSHLGEIDFNDNRVDPGTGTLRVRAVFDNPLLPGTVRRILSPGLFVRIRLPLGAPHQAVIVPERALGSDQGQKFLYVVNAKDEVEYRKVKVGALNKGYRVIEQGLVEGERVVVNGLQRIRPRAKVEPRLEEIPPQAGAVPGVSSLAGQGVLPPSGGGR
jgi:RND family efflux transporter MFP subunit